MIVLDTSAVIAIFRKEQETDAFLGAIAGNSCAVCTVSVMEISIVARTLRSLEADATERWLDSFIDEMGIRVQSADDKVLSLARQAHLAFGKGTGHPAQLNFGDCFSYALARSLNAPLLYKGADFARTDIRSAL